MSKTWTVVAFVVVAIVAYYAGKTGFWGLTTKSTPAPVLNSSSQPVVAPGATPVAY